MLRRVRPGRVDAGVPSRSGVADVPRRRAALGAAARRADGAAERRGRRAPPPGGAGGRRAGRAGSGWPTAAREAAGPCSARRGAGSVGRMGRRSISWVDSLALRGPDPVAYLAVGRLSRPAAVARWGSPSAPGTGAGEDFDYHVATLLTVMASASGRRATARAAGTAATLWAAGDAPRVALWTTLWRLTDDTELARARRRGSRPTPGRRRGLPAQPDPRLPAPTGGSGWSPGWTWTRRSSPPVLSSRHCCRSQTTRGHGGESEGSPTCSPASTTRSC